MAPITEPGDALLAIGIVAGGAGAQEQQAGAEVLDLLHAMVPYAGSSLSSYDPLTGEHRTLASVGYDETVQVHLDTWFVEQDAAYQYLRQVDRTPLRWRDFPFRYEDMFSAREVFVPAGYRDGMTICLYARDGRYTGNLHISTDDRAVLSPEVLPGLCRLQHMLGGITDRMRSIDYLIATMDGPGCDAAIVLQTGEILPVPGRPTGEHLRAGTSLVRALARALPGPDRVTSFRWRDDDGRWHMVRTRRVSRATVVSAREQALPYGLTHGELRVLTRLVAGASNTEIAKSLYLSPRTVGKHVEHILEKLDCSSRTAAATHAVIEGLLFADEEAVRPGHSVHDDGGRRSG